MKKVSYSILSFLLFAAALLLPQTTVNANQFTLQTNNTWTSNYIMAEGQSDFYTLQITQAGLLTLDYQGWSIGDSYFELLSEDMVKVYEKHEIWTSSESDPKTKSVSNWMEAGTYLVKVYAYGNHTGEYRLKASFKAAKNNEKERNNGFESAMSLPAGQLVTGLLSRDDNVDFYRFNLNSKTVLLFTYLSYMHDSYFQIWDKDFQKIHEKEVYYASEESPNTYTYEAVLNAGTYYIKISPYYENCGRYALKYVSVTKVQSIKISNNKVLTAGQTLRLNASTAPLSATNKKIGWSSDNTGVATVDETGKVKAVRAGTVHITASAQDGGGAASTVTVVVKPKKVSSFKASKSTLYKKTVYLSWSYQSGVDGYQICYGTNKSLKGGKNKVSTYSSYTFKNLARKTYYFKVRGFVKKGNKKVYGAWSGVRSCRPR